MIFDLILFFLIGCILLLLLVLVVYKTGFVHETRNSEGHLKHKQSINGLVIMVGVFALITAFFVLFQIQAFDGKHNFFTGLFWTFVLLQLLVLFDSLIIDLLIIGIIRPVFLNIPEETTLETMKTHVKKTYTLGWIFQLPIIIISSLLAYYITN